MPVRVLLLYPAWKRLETEEFPPDATFQCEHEYMSHENNVTAHIPNWTTTRLGFCGGGSGICVSGNAIQENRNPTAASSTPTGLISTASRGRNRTAIISRTSATSGPSAGAGGGEQAATQTLVVSPRSGPHSACCISLMVGAASAPDFVQARTSDTNSGARDDNGRLSFSSTPCRRGHVRARRPTSSMRDGYTGSVTPASTPQAITLELVRDRSLSAVSSNSVVAAAAAGGGGSVTTTAAGPSLPPPGSVCSAIRTVTSSLAVSAMYGNGSGRDGPLPDEATLQSLLSVIAPHLRLVDGWRVVPIPLDPPSQLYREYQLTPTLGDRTHTSQGMVVLVLAPSSTLRLLRSEEGSVEAEAIVLEWIRGELLVKTSSQSKKSRLNNMKKRPTCCTACNEQHTQIFGDHPSPEYDDMLSCLPTLIDHSLSTQRFGSAYNILSYSRGSPPLSATKDLSTTERRYLHYQSGRLARQAALLSSPSSRFGPVHPVLSPKPATRRILSRAREHDAGMDSWSLAFHALLEGILRDAEDMAVIIPYQKIRWHYGRLRHYLDKVTVPRLVVLDLAHKSDRAMGRARYMPRPQSRTDTPFGQCRSHNSEDELEGETEEEYRSDNHHTANNVMEHRNWSNCVFGDPLMATVVGEGASRDFLRGFTGRQSAGQDGEEDGNSNDLPPTYGDIVECPEHAPMRLLLYKCYHETVAIVTEFYRPRKDSTAREFEARKRLNAVLAELDTVEDDPNEERSRRCGLSTVKRVSESGGGGEGPALLQLGTPEL